MLRTIRRAEYAELVALFFLHGAALAAWFVPLSNVLESHGLHSITPYAFACSALAAFVSPLIFGAMADRHASPVKVLRGLAFATAGAMALATLAIQLGWNQWVVVAFIQLHALCSSPTWSISTTIVFSRLNDSKREFGPVRAMATLGWMSGCWVVSALNADSSTLSGMTGVILWLCLGVFTHFLPSVEPPRSDEKLTLVQRLGLDALTLFKNPDHRVIFITAALFCIPLAVFYPYTPRHLAALGYHRTSAWMAMGQVTEIIAMFSLAYLITNWRLKWIIATGLVFGVLRFVLCSMDGPVSILAGISLHGCSFTLVLITTQIYLDERVEKAWKARAQALMALMTGGVGNLIGYLSTGAWFNATTDTVTGTRWPMFWSGLAGAVFVVLLYFLIAYHGRHGSKKLGAAG